VITQLHHKAPAAGESRVLLVMLPGAGIKAPAFAENGMVEAVQARGLPVDVVAVCPDLELYLDGEIAATLHRCVIEPALAQGYTRIWLLGISLGGMGALLYASAHAALVEGLVLLAPFLGTRGTMAELATAGGLASWSPARSIATDHEQRMLKWLQGFLLQQPERPALYLGYGCDDRFALGHRILAEAMRGNDVVTEEGGHDWDTWLKLWRRVLEKSPFAGSGR
jgi:pimeloyl-ACP methyl ester carboxylesterase